MLQVIFCLAGVFALLVLDEVLVHQKILKADYRRKFAHITVGTFVATWPWLVGWRTIEIIAALMVLVVAFNKYNPIFKFNKSLNRQNYGDYFFGLAILACAILTTSNVFFALAILHMALADGFAAIIGRKYGNQWKYKVLGHTKTILGSMTFWIMSILILGIGLLFAHSLISFNSYVVLIVVLPPLLTVLENVSPFGVDNLIIPVAVILALRIAQTG